MPSKFVTETSTTSAVAEAAKAAEVVDGFIDRENDDLDRVRANSEREIAARARSAIEKAWLDRGGPNSELGLPRNHSFDVHGRDGGYVAHFRGGDIVYSDSGKITLENIKRVRLVFSGFALEQRQEKGDEIFGIVSCSSVNSEYSKIVDIQKYKLGPESDNRVAAVDCVLYEGPPSTLQVTLQLVEADSGSESEVRKVIRQKTEVALRAIQQTALAVVGAGGAAEAAAVAGVAESEAVGDMRGLAADLYGEIVHLVLGAGDDPYNSISLTFGAANLETPPPLRTYRCSSDPRSLTYSEGFDPFSYGTDDGGDRGMVRALFRVEAG